MNTAASLTCKICDHKNGENTLLKAREMMFGLRHVFNYFQCDFCQCLQIADVPENLAEYYPTDYYSFSHYDGKRFKGLKGTLYKIRNEASFFRKKFYQKLLHQISPVVKYDFFQGLNLGKQSRILDVGCGNGNVFLYPLQEIGFKNLLGCDPYLNESITYPNGLRILKNQVFEMSGQWDFILYNHAFEHVANPLENLEKIARLLAPGGVCVLRIPTVPCYAWDYYKTNWAQLDAPRHLFLHSPKSITLLCEKAGLVLRDVKYDSTFFQFTGSEKLSEDRALLESYPKSLIKAVIRKFKKIKYQKRAKELNKLGKGDQAAFYLYNK